MIRGRKTFWNTKMIHKKQWVFKHVSEEDGGKEEKEMERNEAIEEPLRTKKWMCKNCQTKMKK